MPVNMINRTGADALIPDQISREIIQEVPKYSMFLTLATKMPNMTAKQTKIPVMASNVIANFVNGDTGLKGTSSFTWENVFITAEEIAVIVPIPEAVLSDADYDIWGEIRPRIVEAFGGVIDGAAFHSINKPDSWPVGIVPGAITAGNDVAANGDLYQAINGVGGVIAKVEEKGVAVNGYVGALPLRARLRGAVDNNKQPIFRTAYSSGAAGTVVYELNGSAIQFNENGAMDATKALLVAGNFKMARYAIRQDITYKLLDQAVITDDTGKVILNLAQQDCVALRAVMRLGWALPKPVNPISGRNYFPFAILTPESGTAIASAAYAVTAPVKAATPQATHASGLGYTAEIAWLPADAAFAAATVYTGTVTLTAAEGYYFPDNFSAADITGLPALAAASAVTVTRVSASVVTVSAVYNATAE